MQGRPTKETKFDFEKEMKYEKRANKFYKIVIVPFKKFIKSINNPDDLIIFRVKGINFPNLKKFLQKKYISNENPNKDKTYFDAMIDYFPEFIDYFKYEDLNTEQQKLFKTFIEKNFKKIYKEQEEYKEKIDKINKIWDKLDPIDSNTNLSTGNFQMDKNVTNSHNEEKKESTNDIQIMKTTNLFTQKENDKKYFVIKKNKHVLETKEKVSTTKEYQKNNNNHDEYYIHHLGLENIKENNLESDILPFFDYTLNQDSQRELINTDGSISNFREYFTNN